jgi:cation diffusion facilitator family transporter
VSQSRLYRFLWLSIAAAVATIALKTAAWLVTGSTGLLSDATESVVNLVAAVVALAALHWASRPPDTDHAYGHAKAEYFSAGFEGTLIFVAALSIVVAAIGRLRDPQPLDDVAAGSPLRRPRRSSPSAWACCSCAKGARSVRSRSRPTGGIC